MSDLTELYQQVIIDHGRRPRHFGPCADANHVKEGFNPLCGDKVKLYIQENAGIVKKATFEGQGCAISMASASLLTEAVTAQSVVEVQQLFHAFSRLVMEGERVLSDEEKDRLKKLMALGGVSAYPSRVKCATLAWHALIGALDDDSTTITTEQGDL